MDSFDQSAIVKPPSANTDHHQLSPVVTLLLRTRCVSPALTTHQTIMVQIKIENL